MKIDLSDKVYLYIPENEECYSSGKEYVMQVIAPQPEGRIGGSDTHVLELAFQQKSKSVFAPIVLFKRNYEYELRLRRRLLAYISCVKANDDDEIAEALENLNEIIPIRIIHSHQYDANFLTQTIKTKCDCLTKVPTVMTCHGWIENTEKDIKETERDFNSYEYADALITVCEKDFNRIRADRRYVEKRMVCIRNGVSIPSEEEYMQTDLLIPDTHDKKVIIYVGRLAYEKRVDLIIRMFSYLLRLRKDIVLFVIGNGDEKENLVNQVKMEGLENYIVFTGLMEMPQKAYKACDLMVLLSETEGTPRSVLECMSYGKTTVATNVGGLHEIIESGENGILLDSNDPRMCANIVNELLDCPKQLEKMGQSARKTIISRFSIGSMCEKVEELYQNMLKEM